MSMLAWRNLIHDEVRLGVTLTGIVFAVVLIVVEFGLLLGFTTTTSSLIDRSGTDLWIIANRVPDIELGVPFTERKLSLVLATPGVAEAEKYVARFTQWKRPDGGQETVQVVGFNLGRIRPRSLVSFIFYRWASRRRSLFCCFFCRFPFRANPGRSTGAAWT